MTSDVVPCEPVLGLALFSPAPNSIELISPKCPSGAQANLAHDGRTKPLKTLTMKGMCPSAQVFFRGRDLCCGENKKIKIEVMEKSKVKVKIQNKSEVSKQVGKTEVGWSFFVASLYK